MLDIAPLPIQTRPKRKQTSDSICLNNILYIFELIEAADGKLKIIPTNSPKQTTRVKHRKYHTKAKGSEFMNTTLYFAGSRNLSQQPPLIQQAAFFKVVFILCDEIT